MSVEPPDQYASPVERRRKERVRAFAERHWLGLGVAADQQAAIEEIRRQYLITAREYFHAASTLYDTLSVQPEKLAARKAPFAMGNRTVQLFLAYSILWEAFNHIYTAAAYTDFARNGPARAPLEDERAKIARVLSPPLLEDANLREIKVLKNGETPNAAINRMIERSSRELREIYGITAEYSLTDMEAFLQGVVEVTETSADATTWEPTREAESWIVKPLDDAGNLIDPELPFSASKYRSVIKWDCYQIRQNLNFLGKSEGSIDDTILIIRAFSLLAPVVSLLLHESRRAALFAL
ncbi:MAG TPA: hypothetical protein PKK15_07465 [Kouleothrix sp.]|uniref:hypothetical protein n=1 Tax=Kouleothrix sp. TaxID=2779161 RepID=UPI002B7B4D5D|nr:hypothetical protein [Kouleothrix sp.]